MACSEKESVFNSLTMSDEWGAPFTTGVCRAIHVWAPQEREGGNECILVRAVLKDMFTVIVNCVAPKWELDMWCIGVASYCLSWWRESDGLVHDL